MKVGIFKEIALEPRGEVLWLAINRPEAANAMNAEVHGQLQAALAMAAVDPEVRAVAFTGAGEKVFSAGIDLRSGGGQPPELLARQRSANLLRTLLAVVDFEKPLVAAVNGVASGGGFLLAMVADLIVAAEHATFVLSEIDVGLTTFPGATLVRELAGARLAADLVLTGRRMSASEAARHGLVAHVAGPGELVERAQELAQRLGAKPPTALALNKRWLRASLREALVRASEASMAARPELYASGEPQAAAAAFFARREARRSGEAGSPVTNDAGGRAHGS